MGAVGGRGGCLVMNHIGWTCLSGHWLHCRFNPPSHVTGYILLMEMNESFALTVGRIGSTRKAAQLGCIIFLKTEFGHFSLHNMSYTVNREIFVLVVR